MAFLALDRLTKHFGTHAAVDGLTLDDPLAELGGHLLGIIGVNI